MLKAKFIDIVEESTHLVFEHIRNIRASITAMISHLFDGEMLVKVLALVLDEFCNLLFNKNNGFIREGVPPLQPIPSGTRIPVVFPPLMGRLPEMTPLPFVALYQIYIQMNP